MDAEPSTYIIDQKDAAYYRNRYLNNCATRTRYLTRLANQLTSIKNTLNLYDSLQDKSYNSDEKLYSDFIQSFENFISLREQLLEKLSEEKQKLLETDFESILKEMSENIKSIENEKNNREIET